MDVRFEIMYNELQVCSTFSFSLSAMEDVVFTGVIEYVGSVLQAGAGPVGKRLRIDLGPLSQGFLPGQSLAVDGVCLTGTSVRATWADFDVVTATVSKTTLGELGAGSKVNLERPISLNDRLSVHLVAGHTDGLATLRKLSGHRQSRVAHFQADTKLTDFMIEKGSVALNGASLTIAELEDGGFSVALIPTTLSNTNLGQLQPGQKVNIETDLIVKYVAKVIAARQEKGITMEQLRQHGFA